MLLADEQFTEFRATEWTELSEFPGLPRRGHSRAKYRCILFGV